MWFCPTKYAPDLWDSGAVYEHYKIFGFLLASEFYLHSSHKQVIQPLEGAKNMNSLRNISWIAWSDKPPYGHMCHASLNRRQLCKYTRLANYVGLQEAADYASECERKRLLTMRVPDAGKRAAKKKVSKSRKSTVKSVGKRPAQQGVRARL